MSWHQWAPRNDMLVPNNIQKFFEGCASPGLQKKKKMRSDINMTNISLQAVWSRGTKQDWANGMYNGHHQKCIKLNT